MGGKFVGGCCGVIAVFRRDCMFAVVAERALFKEGRSGRTGDHTIRVDPETGKILNNPDAEKMWSREYRPEWEPKA